jgi:serine/threonine protein kinase
VDDKELRQVVDLKFNLTSDERTTHFGLRGRATTVFPVESAALSALVPQLSHYNPHNPTDKLVAKLYWPEEERESEADILQKVYEIAKKDKEGKVKHHVPELVWSHAFEDTSTANIRRALGFDDAEKGRRVFYIIVFRELRPITKLNGDDFLSAWWQIIVCHYALWENGVHHRDISPSNLMVYRTSDGRWIGVLNDFDLSSTRDTPSGQERTGTVPFMALELLTEEAIEGQVKHLYQHDAESFIWVLTWVCLCYEDGVYIGKGTKLNAWLRVDADGCREKKNDFLMSGRKAMTPSSSHGCIWEVAQSCLEVIAYHYAPELVPTVEDHVVFQTWFRKSILEAKMLSPALLDVRL